MRIKEWITEYCQKYSLDGLNENWDAKPTVKLFFYNVYRKFRGWEPIYRLRMAIQKIFRKNHISDNQIWDCQSAMAKKILPLLYAFRKFPKSGYPSIYSEWSKNSGYSKEEYDALREKGEIKGGEMDAWNNDIDHIIHAMEYLVWESSDKIHQWYLDIFGKDPYDENEENKYFYWTYEKDGHHCMTFKEEPTDATNVEKHTTYGNRQLLDQVEEYVTRGLVLLGKMWRSFWD
jgi:hypothetical protein